VWHFSESWSHSLSICGGSSAVTLCQAELELLFVSLMYICSVGVEYVALRNEIDVLIFYVKHFCALRLFREVQWKDSVFIQSTKLLIAASSNVDTEFLSPKPEVGSVELFPHPHTPSWRGEWSRDSFLLFEEFSYCSK